MATYVIGDVQGCCDALERLLARIEFSPARDRLWLCGDLVNRGPRSLAALQLAFSLRQSLVMVLGNHDLHLLNRTAGVSQPRERDTLDEVLASPERDELIEWLRHCPLVHRENDTILVHGGVLPSWDWAEVARRAEPVHAGLRSDDWREYLRRIDGEDRETIEVLTRLRMVDARGRAVYGFSGAPEDAPAGQLPWFAAPQRKLAQATILFGHWAALGLRAGDNYIGLDSGCVWGRQLTAIRLEDRQLFQVTCHS
ncbi:MAG TPA: symmetrical bis(5'-nucleosyl)-tetraphosphatase [Terriglobales bacterium]|nr:symmetrical bis(5'-nucleosyl)-tetraphosphatase [Terriglobales bacterium]